jgi:hypothetical protein
VKFLCVACDQAMRLVSTAGPDEGSLTVTFACPGCRQRIAMLTNPWETQLVKTLGVKVAPGGSQAPPAPMAEVRAHLASQRPGMFADSPAPASDPSLSASGEGPGCPFAAMIPGLGAATADGGLGWTPEAEARVERIPGFIRPMARQAIERFARERGHATITDAVMDEARDFMGM